MRKKLEKGSGETLAFICVSPLVLVLIVLVVCLIQTTTLYNHLQYAAYVAARAASVSSSRKDAQTAAKNAAEFNMGAYADQFETMTVTVSPPLKKSSYKTTSKRGSGSSANRFIRDKKDKWQKGMYTKVKVELYGIHGLAESLGLNLAGKKSCELTMAIENGFDYDTDPKK